MKLRRRSTQKSKKKVLRTEFRGRKWPNLSSQWPLSSLPKKKMSKTYYNRDVTRILPLLLPLCLFWVILAFCYFCTIVQVLLQYYYQQLAVLPTITIRIECWEKIFSRCKYIFYVVKYHLFPHNIFVTDKSLLSLLTITSSSSFRSCPWIGTKQFVQNCGYHSNLFIITLNS